jgi:hypothetical protein
MWITFRFRYAPNRYRAGSEIGQPYGLKFFRLRGLRPVCSRSYLRVLTCQKWGRYFFARKGKKIFRSRAKRRVLTASGALRFSAYAGTGRGTGLSGPNKELRKEGSQRHGHSITGWFCTSGEAEKKEAWRGEHLA